MVGVVEFLSAVDFGQSGIKDDLSGMRRVVGKHGRRNDRRAGGFCDGYGIPVHCGRWNGS